MKKVAVIGGSGMVASRFIDLSNQKLEITSLDEKTLDITDRKAVEKYFSENKFDSIINFAAYTNVDGAEKEKGDESGLVWRLNVGGPDNLAEVSRNNNIFLLHISTDFVFPGDENNPGPYSEDSKLPKSSDGIGWYGWTKNRAEEKLKKPGVKCAIVRYGYPFRASDYPLKLDWARNILNLYNEHKLYPLFNDQVYSVLFIDDLVIPLLKILEEELQGVFHIASRDTTTPNEAGKYLLEGYTGKEINIQTGSMEQFLKNEGTTPRSRLGGLKVDVTEKKLGITLKTWKEMINEFLNQYGKRP
jgi:dTDP-4-dehydrorhamnose reductase